MLEGTANNGLQTDPHMNSERPSWFARREIAPFTLEEPEVKKILETDATLIDYRVESITKGSDATAEIVTIINDGHLMKQGRAVSTDVVQGSVESFLNALNK